MHCIGFFAFLGVLHLAASSEQHPPLSRCPDSDDSVVEIKNVTVRNAELGQEAEVRANVEVKETSADDSSTIEISFTTSDGTPVPCVNMIVPKEMKVCGGTTQHEQDLSADWNSKCPVEPGEYTARITFRIPNSALAEWCVGDGNLIATITINDGGRTLACISFPFKVDVP